MGNKESLSLGLVSLEISTDPHESCGVCSIPGSCVWTPWVNTACLGGDVREDGLVYDSEQIWKEMGIIEELSFGSCSGGFAVCF